MSFSTRTRHQTQKTVKAFARDISLINERAKKLGCSAADVIHDLCEQLRKHVYLQELGESFDVMHNNPQQVAEFETENKLWDHTLSDGLTDAP